MPHKHKRKDGDTAISSKNFDLPPTVQAKPLFAIPVKTNSSDADPKPKRSKQKRKRGRAVDDDTPRAFARLMQFQATGKRAASGLDNGDAPKKGKKRKRNDGAEGDGGGGAASSFSPSAAAKISDAISTPVTQSETLKILPGERLGDFARRVDQTLPLSFPRHSNAPASSSSAKIPGLKDRPTTKHNRRLLRMQAEWRETEKRLREKKEEELEEMEEEREEEGLLWAGVSNSGSRKKKGKKGRKGEAGGPVGFVENGADEDEDDDPWAELTRSRAEATRQKNLQDVVQAPPQHLKKVKSRFKEDMFVEGRGRVGGGSGSGSGSGSGYAAAAVVDVHNVPGSVGSLRRREEMGSARRAVIEGYRAMMKGKGLAA